MKTEYKTGIVISGIPHDGGVYNCKCGVPIILLYQSSEPKPKKREVCWNCIDEINKEIA